MNAFQRLLECRWLPLLAAVIAAGLAAPGLNNGFLLDDYLHRAGMLGSERFGEFLGGPQEIFRFFPGDREQVQRVMDIGFLPWWTYPGAKAEFFQFLTVQTHVLDYALWPHSPFLMHLQSLLWFAALTVLVAVFYRRVFGPTWVAGLAALLFAVEDAHALPAGWICNRNVLLAATFGVSCLLAHDQWARSGRRRWFALALVFWAASLCSKEAGIATSAYVLAYALWLQGGSVARKLMTLVPYGAVLVAWRVVRGMLGYGVREVGLYVDPLEAPTRFAGGLVDRAPVFLTGQWAFPPSDVSAVLHGAFGRPLWLWSVAVVVLLAGLFWPLLKRDRLARFFATGMLLAVIPICATFTMDRLLMFVGIGAMGMLAGFVRFAFSPDESAGPWRTYVKAARAAAVGLLVLHLGVAPMALAYRAANPFGSPAAAQSLYMRLPLPAEVAGQDLVVVNAPSPLHVSYLLITGELEGRPLPRRLRCLATGTTPMSVRRTDRRAIVIRPRAGFYPWLLDRLLRSEDHPMHRGETVELSGMRVEVLETTAEGRPVAARFTFDVPLEDSSLRWLRWREGQFEAFTPPRVGEETILSPPPLKRFLLGDFRP